LWHKSAAWKLTAVSHDVVDSQQGPFSILFRASNGDGKKTSKIKLSTVVTPDGLEGFWASYTETVKTGMGGLRKKDKKKKKAKKASKATA
jgi:signal recognition particle subunit SRP14